jgi:sortase A
MRKLSYLLILTGILVILYPTLSHWSEDMQQQELLHALEIADPQADAASAESVGSELHQLFAAAAQETPAAEPVLAEPAAEQPVPEQQPVQEDVQAIDTAKKAALPVSAKKALAAPQTKAIGVIRIESIDLKLPIVEGISAQDLKVAPGHIPGTALPGQIGNAVIAGHRSYSYGRMFNRLEQLEKEDTITIDMGGQSYAYVIYDKKMVDPTDISVLNHNNKDQIVTLITCDEQGKQRLILHAKLKQKA